MDMEQGIRFKLPRPLSHSSITLYNECPQKYKFRYLDRIPETPRHYFSFGHSVHLALESTFWSVMPKAAKGHQRWLPVSRSKT